MTIGRWTKRAAAAAIAAAGVFFIGTGVGCAPIETVGSTGTSLAVPGMPVIPRTLEVSMPAIPPDQDLSIEFTVPAAPATPEQIASGVSVQRGMTLSSGSRVVISPPTELQVEEQRLIENRGRMSAVADSSLAFRTTGHFNFAEQQIERSLLDRGLVLLDRARFEAKLRDNTVDSVPWGWSWWGMSKLVGTAVEALEQEYASGRITEEQMQDRIVELQSRMQRGRQGSGDRVTEPELYDTAELIRAADPEDPDADFILQVNSFRIDRLRDQVISVTDVPGIDALLRDHPRISQVLTRPENAQITLPGYFARLNGKLIEVPTGAVAWVGSHSVSTMNLSGSDFDLLLPIRRTAKPDEQVLSAIDTYNDRLRDLNARAISARSTAEGVIGSALDQDALIDDFDPLAEQTRASLNQQMASAAQSLTSAVRAIEDHVRGQPRVPGQPWTWEYEIGRPTLRGYRLPLQIESDTDRELVNNHKIELAERVAVELVSSIPAD